jgi:hypothetical protein
VSSQEVVVEKNDQVLLPTSIYTSSVYKLPTISNLLDVDKRLDVITSENRALNVDAVQNGLFSISYKSILKSNKYLVELNQEKAINKAMTSAFFDLDALYNAPRLNPENNN